ncbi:MAG: hypothetical protein Q8M15_02500 [Bacteroidota bacterium]|nr:hypothetical protein [Bacteroidota bacterium]
MLYTKEELQLLLGMEGKTIEKVLYHQWVNNAGIEGTMHFIDYMEMRFSDQTKILLHRPDEQERITPLIHVDIAALNADVIKEFKGKIKYVTKDFSETLLWKDLIGNPITAVLLDEDEPGAYTTEALVLEAGEAKVLIGLSMGEGLEAGPFGIVDDE